MINLLNVSSFTISTNPLSYGWTVSNGSSQSTVLNIPSNNILGSQSTITQSAIDSIKISDPILYTTLLNDSSLGYEYYGVRTESSGNIYYDFSYYKWDSGRFIFYKKINWTSENSSSMTGHVVNGFYTDYYSTCRNRFLFSEKSNMK